MITQKQFEEALFICEAYCSQINKLNLKAVKVNEVGCRVKLSSWGLEMQGKSKKKLVGTVVSFKQWMSFKNDGTVTVKWDGVCKPSSMHISQIEVLKI